ncbi:hypothetical protein OJAV_G00095060 [Oryzias javanicus]|uniref:Poly [ADP-ribose] polymerase n=1 Tax=Oryzias javanicus TaxID=123683 RepID=A0A3S2MX41_ORYJA|nr:hypothetical protein OJAV_G00095060 [Oryzias javanicus]
MSDDSPLIVEGDWDPSQSKTVKRKLQLYFESKKKSGGGDCRVELEDDAARVYFNSGEVREQVLKRKNHEIVLEGETIRLRLSSEPSRPFMGSTSIKEDSAGLDSSEPEVKPGDGASSKSQERGVSSANVLSSLEQSPSKELDQNPAVVLENVSDEMSRDFLMMLVGTISGVDENDFSLEIFQESNRAVVTFNNPTDAEKFLSVSQNNKKLQKHGLTARLREPPKSVSVKSPLASKLDPTPAVVLENVSDETSRDYLMILVETISGVDENNFSLEILRESSKAVVTFNNLADAQKFLSASQNNQKLQKHGLTAQPLEAAKSVRVENLPPDMVTDMLDLWFGKEWAQPNNIIRIPEEQAAIVTFSDPKVVESICSTVDHMMRSTPLKLYSYYESLGSALYGKDRPTWKMPKSFTERVHPVIWKFLHMKNLLKSISDQMNPHFCSVKIDDPEAKLSPLQSFLWQKGLTDKDVDNWMQNAQQAFQRFMSEYSAFECAMSTKAWRVAEMDISSVTKGDAAVDFDSSREVLCVAGRADYMQIIRAPVENIVLKAMSFIERQEKGIKEDLQLSSAWFYILKQEGLQKAATDISPELHVSYNEGTEKLTMKGLPEEVSKMKSWISEKYRKMPKKSLFISPALLEYLKTMNFMDMSKNLFTSHGISAAYYIDINGIFLMGTSEKVLADAEDKIRAELLVQSLDVKDKEVLNLKNWEDLKKNLLDTYNSANKKTVTIQLDQERQLKVTVAGFMNPVKEVSRDLKKFIQDYSRVSEKVRVHSRAALEFLEKKKRRNWLSIAKDNNVFVKFDTERSRMTVSGAQINVQKTKSSILEMVDALCTDTLTVDKPGAKKYFLSHGSMLLSTTMTQLNCVVLLQSEIPDEEEEESYGEENSLCYCKVQTNSGVQLCVSRGDICSFSVDAVVNAANEDLKHIGGLALALLKAAGPELQKLSDDHVAKNGKPRPGDAIITDGCNLSCKYVIHAVGPRFSYSDEKTSESRLKSAVKESLRQAESVNCSSVALPAISSGIFGFPVQLCAETIAQARIPSKSWPRRLARSSDVGPVVTIPQQRSNKDSKPSGGYGRGRGRGRGHNQAFRDGQSVGRGGRGSHAGKRGGQSSSGLRKEQQYGGPMRMEEQTTGPKITLIQGNIQDQTTDVIVNTISENLDLTRGAVSKAILQAAGHNLQLAIRPKSGVSSVPFGTVLITDGFRLRCQKVFHAVCPFWDSGRGQAEKDFVSIINFCLEEAEKLQMTSLTFPAIGTGNLGFPRALVASTLRREIESFGRKSQPHFLRNVVVVVHPSDRSSVQCFTQEFSFPTDSGNIQEELAAAAQPFSQSEESFASGKALDSELEYGFGSGSGSGSGSESSSFSKVSSPSLGVYHMQLGRLTLEVSSGDITKESCDVIVNASNPTFNLNTGVSKAILSSAGSMVQRECAKIVSSPSYQGRAMIMTGAGQLPSKHIIHIASQNNADYIRSVVYEVLKLSEKNRFTSVAFPALGTGQGGADPSAVADAMVDAVVDFVRKKTPQFVQSVKILIFQTEMMSDFHSSMRKRQGEEVQEKGLFGKIKDTVSSWFRSEPERPADGPLQREEFEPAVFQLCAENQQTVNEGKKRITQLIVAEQAKRTISDPYIRQLSQTHMEELNNLQKRLTMRIHLERGREEEETKIILEGLTRDVSEAEAEIRDIIRKVERNETLKNKAILVKGLVEWQYQNPGGSLVPFDIYMNLKLEEALEKKQQVKIQINNRDFNADPELRKASDGRNFIELLRKDLKEPENPLPSHWDDMKNDIMKLVPVAAGSQEHTDVMANITQNGLSLNIISIERVQNSCLWQSFQLLKKQMEKKNNHNNNEKILFHGTSADSIDFINNKGFNRSYAGRNGALYGNGSYFAVDPAYSAQNYAQLDNQGHKRMYQARVLVGDFTQGSQGLIVPPAKSGQSADLYDSVTDNTNTPSMFVVFNDSQAYPEYLITFT